METSTIPTTRTLKQWLEKLSPAIYDKAINNVKDPKQLDFRYETGFDALSTAFAFSETPQGFDYWNNIVTDYFIS